MSPSGDGARCRPPLGAGLDSKLRVKLNERRACSSRPSIHRTGDFAGLPRWEVQAPWARDQASLAPNVGHITVAQACRSEDQHDQHSLQISRARAAFSGEVHGSKTSDTMALPGFCIDEAVTECPSERSSVYTWDSDDEVIDALPSSTFIPLCWVHVRCEVTVDLVEDSSSCSMSLRAFDRVLKLSL
mmetsp:Transcript_50288/g.144669  ORF Transcript_50288/g.144669 Transcript_50288/m.144669 type:complete len:187 (+) Transcript_50288:43-603(+)